MRLRVFVPIVGVWAVCLLGATAVGQQVATPQSGTPPQAQQPAFKSGTQVVEVDVRVFDKDGHFVTGLKPEDFEIREDSGPQQIVSLALVQGAAPSAPAPSAPAPSAPAPSAASGPSAPQHPSQVWLFVFDTLHLSPGGLRNTQQAVEAFLRNKFHDGDLGGVVAEGKMANNRMTSVREELIRAVTDIKLPNSTFQYQTEMTRDWPRLQDEFEAWRIAVQSDKSALEQAVIRACTDDPDQCKRFSPDMMVQQKSQNIVTNARASTGLTLRVVEALSNGLARMAGPKTIVFISEGFIVEDMFSAVNDATGQANRAGAHFYTIDARGLNKGSASSSIINQAAAFDAAGPSVRFDTQADGTNALAVDTGGIAIRNENNFGRALDEIQQDTATYYVLGYTPANQSFDGKFRKIDVSVKRPALRVRARRGYLALEPATLLKPTPITTPSGASLAQPAESNTPARAGVSPPTPVPSPANASAAAAVPVPSKKGDAPVEGAASAPAANALRSAIDSQGLVQALQKSAERLAPTKASDLAGQGWARYQKGDLEHAAVFLGTAAESPDAHPWVRYALGLADLALARYPDAVAAWERVRHDVPEFEPVYFNLADGHLLQNDNDGALNVLRDAQTRWPGDPEVWNASGVLEIRRGALDAAVRSFTRATTVAPADSLGFFNLAKACQMRAAKSQRFDSTTQKWTGGEADTRKAAESYTKYIEMGGPFVQQAKEALQVLTWRSDRESLITDPESLIPYR